jgi:predicted porin
MKKSLLALAALTAFAGAASAQSSVTLYGRVDLSIAKNIGSDTKGIQNGSGSRLGFRGVEDLGGGMSALFNIETRFDADTGGAQSVPVCDACTGNRFWGARSFVGLQGGFGQVVFGREYTTAFLGSQLAADPWGWDTIANNAAITGLGGIANVRNDSSVTYKISGGGFSFGAQVAEATDTLNQFATKPFNFVVGYSGGPLKANVAYEKTGEESGAGDTVKMVSVGASYNLGMFTPGFYYAKGTAISGADHKGWLLTATAPLGAGEFRAAYGDLKADGTSVRKQISLGYHYSMSKRTTLYVDFARDSERDDNAAGYDVGLKHNF